MTDQTVTLATLVTRYGWNMQAIAHGERALLHTAMDYATGEDAGLSFRGMAETVAQVNRDMEGQTLVIGGEVYPWTPVRMTKDRAQDLALLGRFLRSTDLGTAPATGSARDLVDIVGAARRYLGVVTVRDAIATWAERDEEDRTLVDLADTLADLGRQASAERARREQEKDREEGQDPAPKGKPRSNAARIRAAIATLSGVNLATLDQAKDEGPLADLVTLVHGMVTAMSPESAQVTPLREVS